MMDEVLRPKNQILGNQVVTGAKKTFSNLFFILIIALMVLPFVTTFNEFLTRIVEDTSLYKLIQSFIVPYEVKLVKTILSVVGIDTLPGAVSFVKNGDIQKVNITWNCIGWQSFVILLISLKSGFSDKFGALNKIEILLIGVLGTFLMNLVRISLVIIILYLFGKFPAIIFHDYGSIILTIAWLFFFWWFTYAYVLEERNPDLSV